MGTSARASVRRKSILAVGFLSMAFLLLLIRPNSAWAEGLLLTLFFGLSLLCASQIAYKHSRKVLRAIRLARRERSLFKAAAEGSQGVFCICKPVCDVSGRVIDFRVTYANRKAEGLFGKQRSELIGQSFSSFLPSESRLLVMGTWARVAATGVSEYLDMDVCSSDSTLVTYSTQVAPLAGSVAISTLRTNEEAAAASRIQELSAFAQSIIESAPISMIATDACGTIIAMNSAAERLTLYRKADLVGQHSLLMLHDPAEVSSRAVQLSHDLDEPVSAGFESLILKPSQGEQETREWTYVRRDKTRASVNLTMMALRTPDKQTTGYLAIAFDMTERKQLTDSIVHMAHFDQLTGLPNRILLNDRLTQAIERAKRFNQKVAVFMVGIDHFKRINESLGHSGGDTVLNFFSEHLQTAVRRTDTVARVSGDEFVVIMPDFRGADDAERCAHLMLQKIGTPTIVGNAEIRVTASIGYCLYPDSAEIAEELLRSADVAMHEAKSAERGSARAFSGQMQREAADRLKMEEELRHALDNGELHLAYQPQVRCSTGEVTAMEMLLRWNSPKRGMVPPTVFIPVAEKAGLLVRMGEWSLRKACFDCADLQRQLGRPLTVAVNLSPWQFSQRNLIPVVTEALAASGLKADSLEIEITEQMLMTNNAGVMETLRQIRDLGISVAIDDFGTGFSSFSYILQYDVDRLKIDRCFVDKSTTDPGAAAIVRTIIAMAHGLNIEVVAEGVETVAQMNFLLRRKCDQVQGYLFSKAVPAEDFTAVVRKIDRWVEDQQKLASEVVNRRARQVNSIVPDEALTYADFSDTTDDESDEPAPRRPHRVAV
jgi:diguanylate cyclase (GGDEF)-like protein/PAS domain S-box-containing protein